MFSKSKLYLLTVLQLTLAVLPLLTISVTGCPTSFFTSQGSSGKEFCNSHYFLASRDQGMISRKKHCYGELSSSPCFLLPHLLVQRILPSPRSSGCAQGRHPDLWQKRPLGPDCWEQTLRNHKGNLPSLTQDLCFRRASHAWCYCLCLIAAMSVPYPGPHPQTRYSGLTLDLPR